jgi:hypothetical protein
MSQTCDMVCQPSWLDRLTYSEDNNYHRYHLVILMAETVTKRAGGDGLKAFNRMVIITYAFLTQITSCEGDKI